MKQLKLLFILLLPTLIIAQKAIITGVILDSNNLPISDVHVSSQYYGTTSDVNGFYLLEITADKAVSITFSHMGHQNVLLEKVLLSSNESFEFNPILKTNVTQIDEITITATGERNVTGITHINPEIIRLIPGANAGIENILKLLPSVSSSNELSTQYNVRGGNYDENLVYVNEIEIYRPFLIRAGQQEGLSFVNSDMIQKVKFSSGGFQAKYGDKLSSVLDISYKKPVSFGLVVDASLLGASTTIETVSKNKKLSSISGIRYRDISLLINSQQTATNIKPRVFDFQTYESYQFSRKLNFGILGNISFNNYINEPQARKTNFGTTNEPKSLFIYYAGKENNLYQTALGAIKATYYVNDNVTLKIIPSIYHTLEEESSDLIAQYELSEADSNLGDVTTLKRLGTQFNRARNTLDALIFNLAHKGTYIKDKNVLDWGVKFTHEDIRDQLRESEFLDSLGFFLIPPSVEFTNNNPEVPF